MPKTVAFLIFDGFQLLDAAGPIAAFEIATALARRAPYTIRVIAKGRGLVKSSSSVALAAEAMRVLKRFDTLIVVGGSGIHDAAKCEVTLNFVRQHSNQVRRICSVCTGSFLLAAAGLLSGRRATTHWGFSPEFAKLFPNVRLRADQIYVRDGKIWTSAGITAGIDLALALIAEDMGEDVAKRVARELVVYYRRPGGQSQHSSLLDVVQVDQRFAPLMLWVREHIREPLSVDMLAERVNMSPRNFARLFSREVGMTPAKAVEKIRLELARERIESGEEKMESIAVATGFGDAERMRRSFIRIYGASPRGLRRNAS